MADYVIVTIKLPKNPAHDPSRKVTGPCPAETQATCTDVTGAHHSILVGTDGMTIEDIRADYEAQGHHVTRIESVEG